MTVSSVRYGDANSASIVILFDDGTSACAPWPCSTFHGALVLDWIAAGNSIAAMPSLSLADYAAAKRLAVETGGIVVNGAAIATDRESQAMIAGAYNYLSYNPSETVQFKAAGGFVTLDAAGMTAVADAVGTHVQACFAREAEVAAAIAAGTVTATGEIDAAFADVAAPWP